MKEPIRFLNDAEWLVQHPGLDTEALGMLARKARKGSVDIGWLRSTGLTAEDLSFLGKDKNTPWDLFKQAADEPGNLKAQRDSNSRLRGIAGELVTQRAARKLFPGYRLEKRQVKTEGGSIVDFDVVPANGSSGLPRRAVEVKGWTGGTWRRALNAWEASRKATARLTTEQKQFVKQLRGAIKQLKDAAGEGRGPPFLVCSNKLSDNARKTLESLLKSEKLEARLAYIDDEEIVSTTKRLRAVFHILERPPAKAGGGAP